MSFEQQGYRPDPDSIRTKPEGHAVAPSVESTRVRPAVRGRRKKEDEGSRILEEEEAHINRSRVKLDELLGNLNEKVEAPTGEYENARMEAIQALGELTLAADRLGRVHDTVAPLLKRMQTIENIRKERGAPRASLEPWEEKFFRDFPQAARALRGEFSKPPSDKELETRVDNASLELQRSFNDWFSRFSEHVENDEFSPIPQLYEKFAKVAQGLKGMFPADMDQRMIALQEAFARAKNEVKKSGREGHLQTLGGGMDPRTRATTETKMKFESDIIDKVGRFLKAVERLSPSHFNYSLAVGKTIETPAPVHDDKPPGSPAQGSGRAAA